MNPDAFDSYPEMLNCDSFPTLHIGKRKIAPKSKVLEWIDQMTSH